VTSRRGLTLLEVLAATVLLAMIGSACAPVIAQALRHCHESPPTTTDFELNNLADQFIESPGAREMSGQNTSTPDASMELSKPGENPGDQITVNICSANARQINADHQWLIFECNGRSVCRWMPLTAGDQLKATPAKLKDGKVQ